LAEWGAGPAIVFLGPGLSWQRASLAPLLAYLDQDRDGGLSAAEITHVDDLLKRADVDGNDVVEMSELRRVANYPPTSVRPTGHSLVVALDANTDWDSLAAQLVRIYDGNTAESSAAVAGATIRERIARGDSTINGSQLRELCAEPADVTLRVEFNTTKQSAEQPHAVSVVSLGPDLSAIADAVVVTTDVISLDIGGDFVELSAAQSPAGEGGDVSASQLAIGAVIDGNPIERLLDVDQDGRFTLRERQQLRGLLAAIDRDADGQVASGEVPLPIRLAVTLGPRVHQMLAMPTSPARAIAPRDAAPTPPDLFLSMDKNGDRDLARNEFLGTTEQFRQFDTDGDALLSVAEALKLSAGQ
jgi:hypothetical protein